MSFYSGFEMPPPATRATPAIPGVKSSKVAKVARVTSPIRESSSSKVAGVARGLNPTTQSLAMLADACEGRPITTDELCAALGDDKTDLDSGELSQAQLRTFAEAVVERHQREAGQTPEGWTQAVLCQRCGPVYLLPMKREGDVLSCPWCDNRRAGFVQNDDGFLIEAQPIPRPAKVRCGDCKHWVPDVIGDGGGIGTCAHSGPMWTDRPAFPGVLRWCSVFTLRTEKLNGGDPR
jgi:hypothetical protein